MAACSRDEQEKENGLEDRDCGRDMPLQYATVPEGCTATPGSGAVAERNSGEIGASNEPVLDLLSRDSMLLVDDPHVESREGGRGDPEKLCRCWHLKHLKGCWGNLVPVVLMMGHGPSRQSSRLMSRPWPQQNRKTWARHIVGV